MCMSTLQVINNVCWRRINRFQLIFPGEGALPPPRPHPRNFKKFVTQIEQHMLMCMLLR